MKRSTSIEGETPKKRRKSRGPRTTSPSSRQRTVKPLSISEVKASSELFSKAIQSRKMDSHEESSPGQKAALQPSAPLPETPPVSSPPENLESVVQKLTPSSGSADMDMSDDEAGPREKLNREREREKSEEDNEKGVLTKIDESSFENEADKDKDQTDTMDLEIVEAKTPEPKADDVRVIATPHQGSGASADDAMELDLNPSEQLEHEHQLSQHIASSQADSSEYATPDKIGTVVSSTWLLDKLAGLTPDTLSSDRDAIIQELHYMEAEIKKLPRAEMQAQQAAANPAAQRLQMVETLIAPQLAKIPDRTWKGYKAKLLRLCAGSAVHNMDYRQRLERVKEIVYMPEEMELVRKGDAERIACAVRVCATVTEILGRDEEIVPEEMAEWVAAQLKDVAWKAKVTSVWRKYWPDASEMVAG